MKSLGPIKTKVNYNARETRMTRSQLIFSFASDWLRILSKYFRPITKRSKVKPVKSHGPIKTKVNYNVRENAGDQVTIDFTFASDWLRIWSKYF